MTISQDLFNFATTLPGDKQRELLRLWERVKELDELAREMHETNKRGLAIGQEGMTLIQALKDGLHMAMTEVEHANPTLAAFIHQRLNEHFEKRRAEVEK